VIDPIEAVQVTLFEDAPGICAVNCVLLPAAGEEAAGETIIEVAGAPLLPDDDLATPTQPEVQIRIDARKIRIA
jgi:hydroxymethylpyrimidine/phosphomethylpyrimidine kinase